MGEIADTILEGDMCQLCGELMEGDGFPQTCATCLSDDDNRKTYVTFGMDHKHKMNNELIDCNCIAVIKCKDAVQGRSLAFKLFGRKFCFEYHENEFTSDMKHFPRGFIEVN